MIQETQAKTLLRKHHRVDSWFLSTAGLNLYRGCGHNCAYCDGRAEKYQVPGEFGVDIGVKINAPEVLRRELDPKGKRTSLRPGYLCLGGGVGDSYQPVEEQYGLTRKILEVVSDFARPVHVLTKSALVERDFDILGKIHAKTRVMVSMSFSTVDDKLAKKLEPQASPPSERLRVLAQAHQRGWGAGMYLMPVIPEITDTAEKIEDCLRQAKQVGVDFVMFGGLTLKDGRQKDHFLKVLAQEFGDFSQAYTKLYPGSPWGNANGAYYARLESVFHPLAKKYNLPVRIPPRFYQDLLEENDKIMVMLEHLEYLAQLSGKPSSYRTAVRSIEKLSAPLSAQRESLRQLPGVGPFTEKIIQEILGTGSSKYLESLLGESGKTD